MDYSLAIGPGWSVLSHIPALTHSRETAFTSMRPVPTETAALLTKNTARWALQADPKIFFTEIRYTSGRP